MTRAGCGIGCGCAVGIGWGCTANRLPASAIFRTSRVRSSISFCLSAGASTLACFSQIRASEYFRPATASSVFFNSLSIFSRFSRASFDSFSCAVFAGLLSEDTFAACRSNVSRLVRTPIVRLTGIMMACRNSASSSTAVPLRISGTRCCCASSFTPLCRGMTATLSLSFTRLMLMLRSAPAASIG